MFTGIVESIGSELILNQANDPSEAKPSKPFPRWKKMRPAVVLL